MNRALEEQRLAALAEIDGAFWSRPECVLAGMDEVGRGPLAGPVVAACVVMPPRALVFHVDDSKKLAEARRAAVCAEIERVAEAISVAWVWPDTIDRINILEATKRAFAMAFAQIGAPVTDVLIDALTGLDICACQHPYIHGDARSYSIAAASIVAKVRRDEYMREQDALYPAYGFIRNKGYGTAEHIEAIKKYGPCPIHRQSFIQKWL